MWIDSRVLPFKCHLVLPVFWKQTSCIVTCREPVKIQSFFHTYCVLFMINVLHHLVFLFFSFLSCLWWIVHLELLVKTLCYCFQSTATFPVNIQIFTLPAIFVLLVLWLFNLYSVGTPLNMQWELCCLLLFMQYFFWEHTDF